MPGPLSGGVKKNLLDLQYAKYLQYYTTAVIILFTYGIGVAIAFITKQIDFYSIGQMLLVFLISYLFSIFETLDVGAKSPASP